MSTSSPAATPNRVPTVSPVQWIHAFAYTPDSSPRVRKNNGYRHPAPVTVDSKDRIPRSEDDALPTWFQSSRAGSGSCQVISGPGFLMPDRDRVLSEGGSDACVSGISSTVPAKRKRPDKEPLSSSSILDGLTQRRARKARSRTRCTSAIEGAGRDRVPNPSNTSVNTLPIRPRSRRIILDAVEIVSRKGSRGRVVDPRTIRVGCAATESADKNASSYYPSPPTSRADRDVGVHDSNSSPHISHPVAVEREECASLELALPLKTSKYFARVSTSPIRSVSKNLPALTPPSSPVLTIPVYIESSDFEYPPLDVSSDDTMQGTVNESSTSTWCNNPGLFDDLMIMLRRLKPILVQESVRDDPWKVLIAVRLLNVTTGKAAIPVFCKIISRWPTPQDLVRARQDELVELLRPLGLYNKRASWLKDVSERFVEDRQAQSCSRISLTSLLSEEWMVPTAPRVHYPGIGPYALDSLRIFCADDTDAWKRVMPQDKELVRYLRWRWAVEEGKVWYPGGTGVIRDVDVPYLITLVDELAAHYDGAIGGKGYMYHFCNDLCDSVANVFN